MEGHKKSKSEVEAEIRQHVAAEKKAFFWVQRLALVEKIDEAECNNMLNSIMVSHYSDITEERSISKVCGYPLCSNPLSKKDKKQKYHISLKEQKVYDASERKCFCCDFCYKASKYIRNQIPESPIWLRTDEVKIQYLERDDIDLCRKMKKMDVDIERRDDERKERENSSDHGHARGEKEKSYKRFDQFEQDEKQSTDVTHRDKTPAYQDKTATHQGKTPAHRDKTPAYQDKTAIHQDKTSAHRDKTAIYQDKTSARRDKTVTNQDKSKNENEETNVMHLIEKLKTILKEWLADTSFLDGCSSSETHSSETHSKESKPSANDTASFNIKALNFLSNNPEWVNETQISDSFKQKLKAKNDRMHAIPHIHSKSQVLMRRKIVKDQIFSVMNKLGPVLQLTTSSLSNANFFQFVNTFRFTSVNIVLQPKEWLIVTICLLIIYSTKCDVLFHLVESKGKELNEFLKKTSDIESLSTIQEMCSDVISFVKDMQRENDTVSTGVIEPVENDSNGNVLLDIIDRPDSITFDMEELD